MRPFAENWTRKLPESMRWADSTAHSICLAALEAVATERGLPDGVEVGEPDEVPFTPTV